MDAFETIVAMLLEREGFWVTPGFKVDLTTGDKRVINLRTCPRWEFDLLAYSARQNELRVVECKSYLDSFGVAYRAVTNPRDRNAPRFKLFNQKAIRDVVFARLKEQLKETHRCLPNPSVRLCLAAGKVKSRVDFEKLERHFRARKWLFLDQQWIKRSLTEAANSKYQNDVSTIVAKLLLRN